MKRTLIAAAVLVLGAAGAGVSLADPGPNGSNNHGLCTAYAANGGHGNSHDTKPANALEAAAEDGDDATSDAQEVANYCAEYLTGNSQNGGGNGNPNPGGKKG
jgi:hypothetical protein